MGGLKKDSLKYQFILNIKKDQEENEVMDINEDESYDDDDNVNYYS